MLPSSETMDLIDAIANTGLRPIMFTPSSSRGKECVGCTPETEYEIEHLPKAGLKWERVAGTRVAFWPAHKWTPAVDDYIGIIFDPSGEESDGGLTD